MDLEIIIEVICIVVTMLFSIFKTSTKDTDVIKNTSTFKKVDLKETFDKIRIELDSIDNNDKIDDEARSKKISSIMAKYNQEMNRIIMKKTLKMIKKLRKHI